VDISSGVFAVDNQASILALGPQKATPRHYLLDQIHHDDEALENFYERRQNPRGMGPTI
jgi:hypothetical protein